MPNVKFVIDADAGKLLAEQKRVLKGQEKLEDGFRDQAKTAEDASRREAAAAKKSADAYDLAERRMTSAVRTRGSTSSYTRGRGYNLAPQTTMTQVRAPGVAGYGGA